MKRLKEIFLQKRYYIHAVCSIVLVLCPLCLLSAQAFWIWSPKTGEWSNPRSAAGMTPQDKLDDAISRFDAQDYTRALKEFKRIVSRFPDAREAAQAQYYLGRCYEALNKHYPAFLEYQKLVKQYPNSTRIQESLERMFFLGEYFIGQPQKKFLGLGVDALVENPGIEIFEKIVETAPYSEFAPKALAQLGMFLFAQKRFDQAREVFDRLIEEYPESALSQTARYQRALAHARDVSSPEYDQTNVTKAKNELEEFFRDHPDFVIGDPAGGEVSQLEEREARKNFDVGNFYEHHDKPDSALIYYGIVVERYPHTAVAESARKNIERIKESGG